MNHPEKNEDENKRTATSSQKALLNMEGEVTEGTGRADIQKVEASS